MDGLDELLAFPTYDLGQDGGGIDGAYTIITVDELGKKGLNIHTDPILLVGKAPVGRYNRRYYNVSRVVGASAYRACGDKR